MFAWVLCVLCVSFSACAKRDSRPADHILRIAQRNEPATLDPQLATLPDEFFIIRALSEGLLTPDPAGGAPLPGVAEKWEVSADGLTYTFHLRPGAKWSNGDPVTAQDFVYSIRRALAGATAAPKASLFLALRGAFQELTGVVDFPVLPGVTAPDPHTLVLTLAQPTADFPSIVASGPWIPVHRQSVEKHGRHWTRPGNYVGNGPFILAEWKPNQRITVRKNPLYGDAAAVKLEGLQFLAFDSGDSEERAFRAGQVDVTMAVPFSKLAGYRAASPAVVHAAPLHETRYLALNTTRPPLDDARVRLALALALDRATLVDKVVRSGQPAFNFVPAGLGGYAPTTRIYEDAAEARRLLTQAGFPQGKGFPHLEIGTWVNTPVLEAIQQMWRDELGITVTIAPREARTHLAALAAGDYAIAFMTAIPDYDGASDLFRQLTGGNPANYPHWLFPEFDHLVATASELTDPVTRNATYQKAEAVLLDEMPVIPLYFNAQNYLVSPAVHGWRADRLWTRFYKDLSTQ